MIEFLTIENTNNPNLLTYLRVETSLVNSISILGGVYLSLFIGDGWRHDSQANNILGLICTVSKDSSSRVCKPELDDKALMPFPFTK